MDCEIPSHCCTLSFLGFCNYILKAEAVFVYKNTVKEKCYPQVLVTTSSVLSADLMLVSLLGHQVNAACCWHGQQTGYETVSKGIKTFKD
jgi:hypothetical protein